MLVLVFVPIMQKEELMGWHLSKVTRTRIKFSYQGKFQCIFYQGIGNLVQVRGELELSKFKLTK